MSRNSAIALIVIWLVLIAVAVYPLFDPKSNHSQRIERSK